MKYFFLYETELPAGSGFQMFGFCHMMWLAVIAICAVIGSFWYARLETKGKQKVNHVMGIWFPIISIYRDAVLIVTGHFDTGYLPLHLCGMALWIAAIYSFTGNRFLGVVYILLCLPGAMGALIFPDWTAYPFFNYMHIHDFVSHGCIVIYGCMLIRDSRLKIKWRDLWMPMAFGLIGMIVMDYVNGWLHTNFWFLNRPSTGSPMVQILEITGEKWYLVGYFLFCTVIVAIWQAVVMVIQRLQAYILIYHSKSV